jgi:hypothetical protein
MCTKREIVGRLQPAGMHKASALEDTIRFSEATTPHDRSQFGITLDNKLSGFRDSSMPLVYAFDILLYLIPSLVGRLNSLNDQPPSLQSSVLLLL